MKIKQLKEIFERLNMAISFFGRCLWTFLSKIYSKKVPEYLVSEKDIYIFLSCLGKLSLSAKSTLQKPILDILPCVNLKIVFRSENRLSSKFNFKDKIWKAMRSLLCYKFQCTSCNATYYSKPKCYFKFRGFEHIGVSACTGKNIRSTKNYVMICCVIIRCVWSYANL